MISLAPKARPRRSPNRVRLVELDGSPVVRPTKDHALSWPDSTDNWRWAVADEPDRVIGVDSMGADVHRSDCVPEPDQTDEEWLARLEEQEAVERRRIETTYFPTVADLAEYDEWLASLDDGRPVEARELFHTIEEWDAIRKGQVTETELAMRSAGMAL